MARLLAVPMLCVWELVTTIGCGKNVVGLDPINEPSSKLVVSDTKVAGEKNDHFFFKNSPIWFSITDFGEIDIDYNSMYPETYEYKVEFAKSVSGRQPVWERDHNFFHDPYTYVAEAFILPQDDNNGMYIFRLIRIKSSGEIKELNRWLSVPVNRGRLVRILVSVSRSIPDRVIYYDDKSLLGIDLEGGKQVFEKGESVILKWEWGYGFKSSELVTIRVVKSGFFFGNISEEDAVVAEEEYPISKKRYVLDIGNMLPGSYYVCVERVNYYDDKEYHGWTLVPFRILP